MFDGKRLTAAEPMEIDIKPARHDALIAVDVQKDFLPGGNLGVSEGDQVIPVISELIDVFREAGRPIFATRDWHPEDHCSFVDRGGSWPPHCVQETEGAEFADDLNIDDSVTVISKGSDRDVESYSGFHDTDLAERLRNIDVKRIIVAGLTTDYCVLQTVLDGREGGFDVVVVEGGIRAVNVEPGDGDRAIERMRESGATILVGEEAA